MVCIQISLSAADHKAIGKTGQTKLENQLNMRGVSDWLDKKVKMDDGLLE